MTNKQFLQEVNNALDIFEYHEPTLENDRKSWERDQAWYSFKLSVINDKNGYYKSMGKIIRSDIVSNDYAYQMIVEVLEALNEIVPDDNDEFDPDNFGSDIDSHADSNTPIYYSDIRDFMTQNTYNVDQYIKMMGKSDSIDSDAQGTYNDNWLQIAWEVIRALND